MPHLQDDTLSEAPPSQTGPEKPATPIPIHSPFAAPLARRVSEESIRTELCEGPLPDSPRDSPPTAASPDDSEVSHATSDRAELIERLKRGESPTWIPNRRVRLAVVSQYDLGMLTAQQLESLFHNGTGNGTPPRSPRPGSRESPALLPSATIARTESRDGGSRGCHENSQKDGVQTGEEDREAEERMRAGRDIERPRSALHSGDFTESQTHLRDGERPISHGQMPPNSSSHTFLATSPPRNFNPFAFERRTPLPTPQGRPRSGLSSLSSSLSSSFAYKPPTSPLVQSQVNDDMELALPMHSIDITTNSPRNPRRHTLTTYHSSPMAFSTPPSHPLPLRREASMPYQAHQPRRSLNSAPIFGRGDSSPQTPALLRSRRPSFSSEASPLQHASMVGSYEESILRGRMSTTPSKPLDFMAQIGVLGLGQCKPSLRCPAHVTLPFSAVFYSYSNTSHGRSIEHDGPSPYVGSIDVENGLPNPDDEQRARRKMQSRYAERHQAEADSDNNNNNMAGMDLDTGEHELADGSEADKHHKPFRLKGRSRSPRAPPGGSYRIPEKGQLQIIIKNQNKTAVKLFLVPYDLAGMGPGTKTFIRQRSYSAGPIIENLPEPVSKTSIAADRPILRYLIHLQICCPAKGRFYLYKSIRVVFANRVPDGKEKLHNEVTFPEPRFSAYKPARTVHQPPPLSGPGAMLAADKAFRRRSSGLSFAEHASQALEVQGFSSNILSRSIQGTVYDFSGGSNLPVEPIPLRLPLPLGRPRAGIDDDNIGANPARSPVSSLATSRPTTQGSEATLSPERGFGNSIASGRGARMQPGIYDKLSKGDVGYGGNAFAPVGTRNGTGGAEGLLSQRLRSLGVQAEDGASRQAPADGQEL
jgi:hypothetical protein